jgi:hypothetical protein
MPAFKSVFVSPNIPVMPTVPVKVWDNEFTIHASPVEAASERVVLKRGDLPTRLSAEIVFHAAPGNFQVDLQTSDTDNDADFVTKVSVDQSEMNANRVCRIEALDIVANYARLKMVSLDNAVGVDGTFRG